MSSLTFIGLGLHDEKGLTLEGLEEVRKSDVAFAEFYTNIMPDLDLERLESQIGKKINVLTRTQLEDDGGREVLQAARKGRAALLVPGDPMIATTHISLRLSLAKEGIKSRIIHAASVMSAICGATGLQSYKFGKAVTIPFDDPLPNSVLDTISVNRSCGLHTLLLLDIRSAQRRQLTIREAVAKLTTASANLKSLLAVGAARIGAPNETVRAARLQALIEEDFGGPPQSAVAVGRLHFIEREALQVLCGAKETDLRDNC